MMRLKQEGYIIQPHTSSGSVPSDRAPALCWDSGWYPLPSISKGWSTISFIRSKPEWKNGRNWPPLLLANMSQEHGDCRHLLNGQLSFQTSWIGQHPGFNSPPGTGPARRSSQAAADRFFNQPVSQTELSEISNRIWIPFLRVWITLRFRQKNRGYLTWKKAAPRVFWVSWKPKMKSNMKPRIWMACNLFLTSRNLLMPVRPQHHWLWLKIKIYWEWFCRDKLTIGAYMLLSAKRNKSKQ